MLDHLVIQHERKTLSISRSAHVLVGEQRFALANRIPLRRNMPCPGTQSRHRFVTAAPNSASRAPVNRQGATMFPIPEAYRRWKIRQRDLYEAVIDRNAERAQMTIESGAPAHMNGV
jgi:hypothetical protein